MEQSGTTAVAAAPATPAPKPAAAWTDEELASTRYADIPPELRDRAEKLKKVRAREGYEKRKKQYLDADKIYKGGHVTAEVVPGFPRYEQLQVAENRRNILYPVLHSSSQRTYGMMQNVYRGPFREYGDREENIIRLTNRTMYMRLATIDTGKLRLVLRRIRSALPEMQKVLRRSNKEYLAPGGRLALYRDLLTAGVDQLALFVNACTPNIFTTNGKKGKDREWKLPKLGYPPNGVFTDPFVYPTIFRDDFNGTLVVQRHEKDKVPEEKENDPELTIPFIFVHGDIPAVPACSKEAAQAVNEMHANDAPNKGAVEYITSIMDRVGCTDPSMRRPQDLSYDFYTFFRAPEPSKLFKLGPLPRKEPAPEGKPRPEDGRYSSPVPAPPASSHTQTAASTRNERSPESSPSAPPGAAPA
jgi:hypothetical protein